MAHTSRLLCKAFCKLLKLFFVYLCLSRETFGNDSNIPIVYNLVVSFRKFIHFPPRINFLLIKHFILSSQGKVAVWHKHYLSILTFVQKVQKVQKEIFDKTSIFESNINFRWYFIPKIHKTTLNVKWIFDITRIFGMVCNSIKVAVKKKRHRAF